MLTVSGNWSPILLYYRRLNKIYRLPQTTWAINPCCFGKVAMRANALELLAKLEFLFLRLTIRFDG